MEFNSHKALTNTAWNIIGSVWPIIFSVTITPIIVLSLGIKDYGIYTFFNTVISLLGLLDLGVSTAVSKYLSEYYGQGNTEKIKKLLGTTLLIFFGIGIIGLLIFVVGAIIPTLFDSLADYSKYRIGIIFAGMAFLMMVMSSIYSITFTSLQRFDIGSKMGIAIITFQQISILVLVLLGYSINEIFITQFIITVFSYFVQKNIAEQILPELRSKFFWDKTEAWKCYKFGLVTFVNNIATTSLTYLDRLIIPFFLGPSSLTYYSLPGNIATRIPGIANSLSGVIFPMTSSLNGTGDLKKIKTLYIRSFRLITVISASITVTTISYAYPILKYWISIDLAEKASAVLVILAITNFILALSGPLSSFLLGLGKLRFLTTLSVLMAAMNTILLVILLPLDGITGAAWAYLISLLPVIYMFYFTEKHYLSLTERRSYYRNMFFGNIFVSLIIYLLAKLFLVQFITNLAMVLVIGGLTMILYLTLYWLFNYFEKEDIESIKLFLQRIAKYDK